MNVSTAYLERVGGGLAAVLHSLFDGVGEEASLVRLLPDSMVEPGEYLLVVSTEGGVRATRRVNILQGLAEATVVRGYPSELNRTVTRGAYNITITVASTSSGNYNITISVCPSLGVTMLYVRGEIYNSTRQPPKWIDGYYVYVDPYVPYTYPLCSLWYWAPIASSEFPVTIIVLTMYRR